MTVFAIEHAVESDMLAVHHGCLAVGAIALTFEAVLLVVKELGGAYCSTRTTEQSTVRGGMVATWLTCLAITVAGTFVVHVEVQILRLECHVLKQGVMWIPVGSKTSLKKHGRRV